MILAKPVWEMPFDSSETAPGLHDWFVVPIWKSNQIIRLFTLRLRNDEHVPPTQSIVGEFGYL